MSTAASRSSGSPPLIRTPAAAPRPVATMTAVGTARPIAHGHAMIRTATAAVIAWTSDGSAGTIHQIAEVAIAIEITTGTKMLETRSARRWIGACDPWASRIRRTICASTLAAPTVVASTSNAPAVLTVAPMTRSPGCFSTGNDSPVSIDSSTAPVPRRTTPSTGNRSPGRTSTTSPARTSAMGISSSPPSRRTRAVDGCRAARSRSARVVCRFARASIALPSSTSAMIRMIAS